MRQGLEWVTVAPYLGGHFGRSGLLAVLMVLKGFGPTLLIRAELCLGQLNLVEDSRIGRYGGVFDDEVNGVQMKELEVTF